jgi:hypothetical protein
MKLDITKGKNTDKLSPVEFPISCPAHRRTAIMDSSKQRESQAPQQEVIVDPWARPKIDPFDLLASFEPFETGAGKAISDLNAYRSITPNNMPELSRDGVSEPNTDISDGFNLDIGIDIFDDSWMPFGPSDTAGLLDMSSFNVNSGEDLSMFDDDQPPVYFQSRGGPLNTSDLDRHFRFDTSMYSMLTGDQLPTVQPSSIHKPPAVKPALTHISASSMGLTASLLSQHQFALSKSHKPGHISKGPQSQTMGLIDKRPGSTPLSNVTGLKLPPGCQRSLTDLEKKQARDLRQAKDCWACHFLKATCSPCSLGKPCEPNTSPFESRLPGQVADLTNSRTESNAQLAPIQENYESSHPRSPTTQHALQPRSISEEPTSAVPKTTNFSPDPSQLCEASHDGGSLPEPGLMMSNTIFFSSAQPNSSQTAPQEYRFQPWYGASAVSAAAAVVGPVGLPLGGMAMQYPPIQVGEAFQLYPTLSGAKSATSTELHVYQVATGNIGQSSEKPLEENSASCDQSQISSTVLREGNQTLTRCQTQEGSRRSSAPTLDDESATKPTPSVQGESSSSRSNTLSSFTEDDTDWGEDEIDGSVHDLHFSSFSAFSKEEVLSQEVKDSLMRPVFSPMKQKLIDRIMKEFWVIFNQESEAIQ